MSANTIETSNPKSLDLDKLAKAVTKAAEVLGAYKVSGSEYFESVKHEFIIPKDVHSRDNVFKLIKELADFATCWASEFSRKEIFESEMSLAYGKAWVQVEPDNALAQAYVSKAQADLTWFSDIAFARAAIVNVGVDGAAKAQASSNLALAESVFNILANANADGDELYALKARVQASVSAVAVAKQIQAASPASSKNGFFSTPVKLLCGTAATLSAGSIASGVLAGLAITASITSPVAIALGVAAALAITMLIVLAIKEHLAKINNQTSETTSPSAPAH